MGFLDKAKQAAADAKQAATDFQAANPNLMSGSLGGGSGGGAPADRLLRDLGALAYLDAQGRPGSAQENQRIMGELQALESAGRLDLSLTSTQGGPGAPPPPPPPPGAAGATGAPPPPPVSGGAEGLGGGTGTGAPPPPPNWS